MYSSESNQYTAVLTPSHVPDHYPILCPPLEQNNLPSSMHPFRVRPPRPAVQDRYRAAQIQDIPQENIPINTYSYTADRHSPELDKRSSPEIEFSAYTTRAKSTSPTNSDDKSSSSSSPNLHSSSPDSSFCQISLISQSNVIESKSGHGGVAETGFNPLGCTLYIQESNVVREDEVKSESEFSVWDISTSSSTTPSLARTTSPPSVQESHSNNSSPSRLPPTPTQAEPGLVGGLQNKIKPVVNGVGRGSIGRGVKSKKRLNSAGEHTVGGTLETAPIGWGELPMNPKDNFDDGTEFWGQPEKPIIKPDNDMLMYLKTPYPSFDPYEMNNTTKHSSQFTSLTDQQKRILQEIMQSNFDFPSAISDDTMSMGGLSHTYSHSNMSSMYPRHFSESNLQGPSMQQFIMQRNVINLLMKQQYLQVQKGLTLEQAIQYLLQETKSQHQKLMSTLYQQGNKYSPQLNQQLQASNMFISLLQQQLSNVTAPPMEGFSMGNHYHNKPTYIPSLTEPHTPSYEHHYPTTPQEYQMGYPPPQAPRQGQGQAKNQQWIVQQLVKFHMFNNDNDNKSESKSIGKDHMNMNFSKSLDPHVHDTPMKYNMIRSSSLIDPLVSDYNRHRKINSSLSSLHTEESYNFSELNPSLYEAFEDKLVESEESVFQDSFDRVPPSPSFATQGHTFSPGALAFYPPGHFHEPENKVPNSMFSSLPANLHPSSYEPPSPRLFYPNKLENSPLDYETYDPADLNSLPTRPHNKSPTQFPDKYIPLSMHGNKSYTASPYTPQYMLDGSTSSSMGLKTDSLTCSLPTGAGMERSDAAWLLLTGLNVRMDKIQLERFFTPLGCTSVVHSAKNRTAMLTFKQASDADTARNGLKSMLGADMFDTCEICTDTNELSYFISKFAESPRSPVRDTTPWGYSGLSGSMSSSFTSESSTPFTNPSDPPSEDMSQFEEQQIWMNYLPNDLI